MLLHHRGHAAAALFAPGRWCLRSLGREDPRENRRVLFSAMLVGEGGFPSGLTCAHRSSSAPSVEAGLGQPGPLSAESGPVSHSAAVGPRGEESAELGLRTAVCKTPLVAPTSSTVLLAASGRGCVAAPVISCPVSCLIPRGAAGLHHVPASNGPSPGHGQVGTPCLLPCSAYLLVCLFSFTNSEMTKACLGL